MEELNATGRRATIRVATSPSDSRSTGMNVGTSIPSQIQVHRTEIAVATPVAPSQDDRAEVEVPPLEVVAAKEDCVNFRDRRVQIGLGIVVLLIGILSVALGVALSNDGNSSGENSQPDTGTGGVAATPTTAPGPTTLPTLRTSHPTLILTAPPSPSPSNAPSAMPSLAPTFSAPPTSLAWVQVGTDLLGPSKDDEFGRSVSLSGNGSRLVIGAIRGGRSTGIVKAFELIGDSWTQLGPDIIGDAPSDEFGGEVSMSGDGSRIAIGARDNSGSRGQVKVFEYKDSSKEWIQLGDPVLGVAEIDYFGASLSLSEDGNLFAAGAYFNDDGGDIGDNRGHVRVFQYVSGKWSQLGETISGKSPGETAGYAVSLSANGKRVALDGANSARVYEFNGEEWTQLGQDLTGSGNFGFSLSLSADGKFVAIAAPGSHGNGSGSGSVSVLSYSEQSSAWSLVGDEIFGESAGDSSGFWGLSMSREGSHVAIGSHKNGSNGESSGHVRVFSNNEGSWVQVGDAVLGDTTGDEFGISVSISDDGTRLAAGAHYSSSNGFRSGQVKVYDFRGVA